MRTAGLLFILCYLVWPSLSHAQNNDESIINVQASVQSSLDIITLKNIGFEKIQPGQQEIRISPVENLNAGKIKINGQPGAEINISFIEEQQLQHASGQGHLVFHYLISGNSRDEQLSSELIDFDNRTAVLNDEGEFFFWIGGYANVENLKPGSYMGDFTLEVEHN